MFFLFFFGLRSCVVQNIPPCAGLVSALNFNDTYIVKQFNNQLQESPGEGSQKIRLHKMCAKGQNIHFFPSVVSIPYIARNDYNLL